MKNKKQKVQKREIFQGYDDRQHFTNHNAEEKQFKQKPTGLELPKTTGILWH